MRTANPALTEATFTRVPRAASGDAMTIGGAVNKTGILLLIAGITATFAWGQSYRPPNFFDGAATFQPTMWLWVGVIGGFIAALITIFKQTWAPVTAPIYAGLEGLFLGAISAGFEAMYPGIVVQAMIGTFGTMFALLAAYRSGLIRATENFRLGVTAATGGIALLYLVGWVMRMFGSGIPYIHESGLIGIGFSVFVVGVAAMNLVLDFDFIEQGAERRAPKYMEWYAAFGLMVTLVWLYIEMLRLLAKLRSRD